MYQTDPPCSPKDVLPTMYDLPSEYPGDAGLPDEFHAFQAQLLQNTFCPPNYSADEVFAAIDMNLYYDVHHPLRYKRPDWFGVVGVPRLYEGQDMRLSYVVWQEGVNPLIVVELLSPSTEAEDLGQKLRAANQPPTKWEVYERILRIPYYVVFDRYTDQLQAFRLEGDEYTRLILEQPRLWINTVQLGVGVWSGLYQGINRLWLRWYDASGNWILTSAEQEAQRAEQEAQRADQEAQRADQEAQRADQEAQRAEQERQRAERLIAQLRALNIEPDLDDRA